MLCVAAQAAEPLPALHAHRSPVTVSGVSAGGYMAVQMHVAYSSVVKGAGVIAGGPYYCAQGSLFAAYYNCMDPGFFAPLPKMATLKAKTEAFAAAGRVDATLHLAASRAWLFTGSRDRTVLASVVEALDAYYAQYNVQTTVVRGQPAGHAMVTEHYGNACGSSAAPYINDCDYDAAGEMLKFLLGALAAPAATPSGRLVRFDQARYGGGDAHSRHQPDHRPLSADDRALSRDLQSSRLLGLVGLQRRRLRHEGGRAAPRREGHARPAEQVISAQLSESLQCSVARRPS